jgi:hypothetical protein
VKTHLFSWLEENYLWTCFWISGFKSKYKRYSRLLKCTRECKYFISGQKGRNSWQRKMGKISSKDSVLYRWALYVWILWWLKKLHAFNLVVSNWRINREWHYNSTKDNKVKISKPYMTKSLTINRQREQLNILVFGFIDFYA